MTGVLEGLRQSPLRDLRAAVVEFATWHPDAVSLMTFHLAMLFLLSARLVVPGLGAVGTPATLVSLVVAATWVSATLCSTTPSEGHQPVRWALFVYGWWMLVSYGVANTGALSVVASPGADREMISLVGLFGVSLLVADGVRDVERLDTLLRRIVLFAAVMALIGIAQFLTPLDPVQFLRLPGLVEEIEIITSKSRSLFDRPFSTALHAIEFGVVLGMVLPLAAHYAIFEERVRRRRMHVAALVLIAVAIPMSVSRSAVLSVAVGMLVVSTAWSWRLRINVASVGALLTIGIGVAVPGLIGTLRSLFLRAGTDPSIEGRLEDFSAVRSLLSDNLLTGLGPGVFNPTDHFLLDNEYLYTVLSVGVPGLFALCLLMTVAAVAAWRAGRASQVYSATSRSRAVCAGIAVCAASMATFDALSFRIFESLLFVLVGAAGALWRIERETS